VKKQEIDHILVKMLDSHREVSDLNFTVGKPMQVESSGELLPVEMRGSSKPLTPFQTEVIALNLINQERRLTEAVLKTGSCDLSYALPGKARFRVNIFSQGGNFSIVCRKLESKIPTIEERGLAIDVRPNEAGDAAWADPDRVRQILTNLVGNALKFTTQGEVVVEVMRYQPREPQPTAVQPIAEPSITLRPSSVM